MLQPFIVLGDRTDHGGEVITAFATHTINGKSTARMGDKVSCPRCRGVYPIVQGNPTCLIHGVPAAYNGGKTACGARLISSQATALHELTSGVGHGASAAAVPDHRGDIGAGMSADYLDEPIDPTSRTNKVFRGRFRVIDSAAGGPIAGLRVRVRSTGGVCRLDTTDADGYTQWVEHEAEEALAFDLVVDDSAP